MALRPLLLLAAGALACGCAATRVHSGLPPGPIARDFDGRWHAAFLFGSLPLQGGYDLRQLCPSGWSEVRFHSDEFTLAASLVTAFLYTPSRITVICAAEDGRRPPPLGPYASPRRGRR
ncbi:MAG TPA: hypothetical protein VER33_16110 [Polyangiaceae bacterium]|nr:hypothetical protein [Polyangiaceae bacterium]